MESSLPWWAHLTTGGRKAQNFDSQAGLKSSAGYGERVATATPRLPARPKVQGIVNFYTPQD
jgi:hypothetical protein